MKICRTSWVLNLCLIAVTNSYCLNPVMHYRNTKYHVYSQNRTHLNRWWISFTVYNKTSWRQNVTDMFDILYEYWILFFLWNLYIYICVCLVCIFWPQSFRDPRQEGVPCIVLPPTCLGISDWRELCGCVAMTQPLLQLFTNPTCLALYLSPPCPSVSLSAAWCWYGLSECSQLTS